MDKKIILLIIVPVIVSLIFVVLNLFPFYQEIEIKFFDILLHVKPGIKESPEIRFINIDEDSISKVGLFPWSRDIMADGLILLKEFQAAYALFDIEYIDPSPQGVDGVYLNDAIPPLFTSEFAEINEQIQNLFLAIKSKQLPLSDAEEYIDELLWANNEVKEKLLESVGKIARDNDLYLGQSAHLFEKAYFTINLPSEEEASEGSLEVAEDLKEYALKNIALKSIDLRDPVVHIPEAIKPAIMPILSQCAGAGYPNVTIDNDGIIRRIDLIKNYKGNYFAQLAFAPLLDYLGNPEIIYYKNKIVLKNVKSHTRLSGKNEKDITIPLTKDQRVLINWVKKDFDESFGEHVSYYKLVEHKKLEGDLINNLFRVMRPARFFTYYEGEEDPYDLYMYSEDIKDEILNGGDPAAMDEYREIRDHFFSEIGSFLTGPAMDRMIEKVDEILSTQGVREETYAEYKELREFTKNVFEKTRGIYNELMELRSYLREYIPGAICFIGWTGISTTDIGVTAFSEKYMNVGVHASIMNTILQENFLDILPWWVSMIFAFVMAVIINLIIRNLKPLHSILVGMGFIIGIIFIISVFFYFTGIYTNILTPTLVCFFTFIIRIFTVFMETYKEKTFIRGAFTQYLSTDVVDELIRSPEKLHLGGVEKTLTAFFTDIKGFSTVSEQLNPTDLVKLLNAYLTEMSNIILSLKGTIDKYEGDAIISFFGAPVAFEDHAARACLAAARMKRMERLLNEHFIRESLSPGPLLTRIGINTGRMVVGNMGTTQKMDYTIMGNAVNLAARLEGVNKKYGSWILISEATYNEGCEKIVARQLDRVRVVGIHTPVRLYEIIDEKEIVKPDIIEAVDIFHNALQLFEKKEWNKALKGFEEVLKIIPEDGPSLFFIERCKEYIIKAPSENWDGVFNLTMK
ncbi:MAG: CHASE2 domain-containing protein [Spirochaetales bacterium]|nr:CHASE2 domain-containing protein [Spirochaetales bacterium]